MMAARLGQFQNPATQTKAVALQRFQPVSRRIFLENPGTIETVAPKAN